MTQLADQHRKKARGRQPISRHPLFPVIVALWIGAVFALVTLALTPAIGSVMRIVAVLAMAVLGGAIGMAMTRRIASPKKPAAAVPPEPAEDGADPLWSELKSRRGAPEDAEPVPIIVETPPALDREPQFLDVAAVGLPDPFGDTAPAIETTEAESVPAQSAPTQSAPAGTKAAERIGKADLDDLSCVALLERLALSLQRRDARQRSLDPAALAEALKRYQLPAESLEPAPAQPAAEEPMAFPANSERRKLQGAAPAATRPFDEPAPTRTAQEDSLQTEQALREALAALQRMSGAA